MLSPLMTLTNILRKHIKERISAAPWSLAHATIHIMRKPKTSIKLKKKIPPNFLKILNAMNAKKVHWTRSMSTSESQSSI